MSVTPSVVNLTDGSTTISTVETSLNPDIVFLLDTTGVSVSSTIKNGIIAMMQSIAAAHPTAQFAVAEYKCMTVTPAFKVHRDLTGDQAAIQTALNSLTEGSNQTYSDALNALYQVATGAITFRQNSARVVYWSYQCASNGPSNGHDFTYWDIPPTPGSVSMKMCESRMRVVCHVAGNLDGSGPPGNDPYQEVIPLFTGGECFWVSVPAATVTNYILGELKRVPIDVRPSVVTSAPELSLSFSPSALFVNMGTDASFSDLVTVSPSATPGSTLTAQVDYLLFGKHTDGFLQTVSVTVPKHGTLLAVSDGSASVQSPGVLSAVLTDAVTGAPIAGATVQFTMGTSGGSGVTNGSGLATCAITASEGAGTYPIKASFAGNGQYLATTQLANYTITQRTSTLAYTGPTACEQGSAVTLSAVLKGGEGTPINASTVTFTLGTGAGAASFTATTNTSGIATCTITASDPPGTYPLAVYFAGSARFLPTIAAASCAVLRKATSLQYNGPTVIEQGSDVTLSCVLKDGGGAPICGRAVTFTLGTGAPLTATTDTSGSATYPITSSDPPGSYPIAVSFAGDALYLPRTGAAQYTVVPKKTALQYTGPTVIEQGSSVTLSCVLKDIGGAPISGRTVTFTQGTGGGATSSTATSGQDGIATCPMIASEPPGTYPITVSFSGDASLSPAVGIAQYAVARKATRLDSTGATVIEQGSTGTLSCVLKDSGGIPISDRAVTFTLGIDAGSPSFAATTDPSGIATCPMTPSDPPWTYPITISFSGDALYLPTAVAAQYTIAQP